MRGDVHRPRSPRGGRGDELAGARFAVVVQSDSLPLSTWLVAPTSRSARSASFRAEIVIAHATTRVLAGQMAAVDPERLGERAGHLTQDELQRVNAALRIVLKL